MSIACSLIEFVVLIYSNLLVLLEVAGKCSLTLSSLYQRFHMIQNFRCSKLCYGQTFYMNKMSIIATPKPSSIEVPNWSSFIMSCPKGAIQVMAQERNGPTSTVPPGISI